MPYSLFQTLNISRQDMLSRLSDLDVVSNNLANVNTAGYKPSRANFQELLTAMSKGGDALKNTQILTQQGSLATTSNPLDWAIDGEGFFQVSLPGGTTGYSRDGQFLMDADGNLVNTSGFPLIWDGDMPENVTELTLMPGGSIMARTADGTRSEIGQIELARFANPSGLIENGQNIYLESDNSGEAQLGAPGDENFGQVKTHAYEQANVNLADEMTHIMTLQRAFQMAVRAFQQTDTMISQAIHMRKD